MSRKITNFFNTDFHKMYSFERLQNNIFWRSYCELGNYLFLNVIDLKISIKDVYIC